MLSVVRLLSILSTIKDDDRFYLVDGEETNAELKSKFTTGKDIKDFITAGIAGPGGLDTEMQFKDGTGIKTSTLAVVESGFPTLLKGTHITPLFSGVVQSFAIDTVSDTSNEVWPIYTITDEETVYIEWWVICRKQSASTFTVVRKTSALSNFSGLSQDTATLDNFVLAGTSVTEAFNGNDFEVTFNTDGAIWDKTICAWIYQIT